jgi:hypothetical protein
LGSQILVGLRDIAQANDIQSGIAICAMYGFGIFGPVFYVIVTESNQYWKSFSYNFWFAGSFLFLTIPMVLIIVANWFNFIVVDEKVPYPVFLVIFMFFAAAVALS